MKTNTKITVQVICSCLILATFWTMTKMWWDSNQKCVELQNHITIMEKHIPTLTELQEKLVKAGYDIGPKGVDDEWGKYTKLAWERAICDQYAEKAFEKMQRKNVERKTNELYRETNKER